MATARIAAGSVFDTVAATANAVSAIANTASDSVLMLHDFVAKHRKMQQIKTIIDLDSYENRVIEDSSVETIKRRIDINKFLESNPDYKTQYQEELDRVKALFKSPVEESATILKVA